MKLGELIKELRERKKLSLSQFSKKTGLSKSSLSYIENNKNSPTIENFIKICEALDIEPDEFYKLHKEITNGTVNFQNGELINFNKTNNQNSYNENYAFKTATEAMEFILNQKSIAAYGDFDRDKLSDEDIVALANELLNHLKLLGYKYKK